jgi:hypothetical protein
MTGKANDLALEMGEEIVDFVGAVDDRPFEIDHHASERARLPLRPCLLLLLSLRSRLR